MSKNIDPEEPEMTTMLLRLFQKQVEEQCRFLLLSAARVNAGLAQANKDTVWCDLHNLLVAGANISKLLWGKNGTIAKQREPLRQSLGVGNKSPLKQRRMRNNYEHFDDRLDVWNRDSLSHNYVDHLLGPVSMIAGIDKIDLFRSFDPNGAIAHFWGKAFDIQAIVAETDRLLPIVTVEAAKPHWEPPNSTSGGGQEQISPSA